MRILLIDPLHKLKVSKDSTLFFAAQLKQAGVETRFLFIEDLSLNNTGDKTRLRVADFTFEFEKNSKSSSFNRLQSVSLVGYEWVDLRQIDIIDMRLDPPFDTRYLQVLWMLEILQSQGVKVINRPQTIANYNEKISAYFLAQEPHRFPSFVGCVGADLDSFLLHQSPSEYFILKPLNLFQGEGVVKVSREQMLSRETQKELLKPYDFFVLQPFATSLAEKGELRSLFYDGHHVGTILKIPPAGSFLANIAQGATFEAAPLQGSLYREASRLAQHFAGLGAPWIAFDLLDDKISEINMTCPGLLVEVLEANKVSVPENMLKPVFED